MELYSIVSGIVVIAAVVAAVVFIVYLLRVTLVETSPRTRPGRRRKPPRAVASTPSPLGRRVALLLPHWLSRP